MLCVANTPFVLSDDMQNVVILSVVMLSVGAQNKVVLNRDWDLHYQDRVLNQDFIATYFRHVESGTGLDDFDWGLNPFFMTIWAVSSPD